MPTITLDWMRPEAPYMPVATAGLLRIISPQDPSATAVWQPVDAIDVLTVQTSLDASEVAEAIVSSPWPELGRIAWPGGAPSQGLKPTLKAAGQPLSTYRALLASTDEASPERALLRAIVTDGALDADKVPMRSRLLRGVKADLSGVKRAAALDAGELLAELTEGPLFRSGDSGLGLGLVPEVQTFGGTTGPTPSSVGAYSALLHRLLWNGVLALTPLGVDRGPARTVGGPLSTEPDVLSWPVWTVPLGLRALRAAYGFAAIHADAPDRAALHSRGIASVYRARAVPLSSMVAVFRWGDRVA